MIACVRGMILHSWVCTTVERHSKIVCQSTNFYIKGAVCSTHCWHLISKSLDCVTLSLSIMASTIFQRRAAACVTVFLGRQRTQVVNRLELWFIESSLATHCAAAFLWVSVCSHTLYLTCCLLFFMSLLTMMLDSQSGKPRWVPLRGQIYCFPMWSYCVDDLGFSLGRWRPVQI